MNQNYDLASAPRRIKSLISRAVSNSPAATVLVAKLIPTAKPGLQPRIDAYNAALPGVVRDLRQEGKRVLLVDMKRVLVSDGLQNDAHPTDVGYRKMAVVWFGGVLEAHDKGWIRPPGEESAPMAPRVRHVRRHQRRRQSRLPGRLPRRRGPRLAEPWRQLGVS
jgi:hypothetical protein